MRKIKCCHLNSKSVEEFSHRNDRDLLNIKIGVKKRGSLVKKMKKLDDVVLKNEFQKGLLLVDNFTDTLKSNILVSDFWGNKEKYLLHTGYYNAYKSLQQKYENIRFNNKLTRKIINKPEFMDIRAKKIAADNLEKSRSTNKISNHQASHKKASRSTIQRNEFYFQKCSVLTNTLKKMLTSL